MQGALGADVSGLDVRTVDAADLAGIRAALLEYHVLALRNQRLDPAALSAFAGKLGDREVYPFAQSLPDDPFVVPIVKEPEDESNFGGIWHTDSSYLPAPPSLTLLYAVELPGSGGDTFFADMHAAYRACRKSTACADRRYDRAIHARRSCTTKTARTRRSPARIETGGRPARR